MNGHKLKGSADQLYFFMADNGTVNTIGNVEVPKAIWFKSDSRMLITVRNRCPDFIRLLMNPALLAVTCETMKCTLIYNLSSFISFSGTL